MTTAHDKARYIAMADGVFSVDSVEHLLKWGERAGWDIDAFMINSIAREREFKSHYPDAPPLFAIDASPAVDPAPGGRHPQRIILGPDELLRCITDEATRGLVEGAMAHNQGRAGSTPAPATI
jgi:hypothetical protein